MSAGGFLIIGHGVCAFAACIFPEHVLAIGLLAAGPFLAALFLRRPKVSRVEMDFDRLMDRIRQHLYSETMQTLAFYWCKTIYRSAYDRREWKVLDGLLEDILSGKRTVTEDCRRVIIDLKTWVKTAGHPTVQAAHQPGVQLLESRPTLNSETLVPYVVRLLNDWLPAEVARLLVSESEEGSSPQEYGIPGVALGRALERLLLREHLSPATLEALLHPELFSARLVYPAHYEILQDVVLFLLGRTDAPTPAVLPATLLCVAPDAPFSSDYGEAVRSALPGRRSAPEELRVPIAPAQAMRVLVLQR